MKVSVNFVRLVIFLPIIIFLFGIISNYNVYSSDSPYNLYDSDNYQYEKNGDKVLFVVDYSNSMGEFLNHKTKANLVKETMDYILPQISPQTKVGLRVYGHTCNLIAYNACRSSELLVPLGFVNSASIMQSMSKLRPRGMTPITYSLKQAVKEDFAGYDGMKHIILLTDGGENCDESPCDFSIDLVKERKDIKIDVIAFNVHDKDDLAQLKCTANVTGGNFIQAETQAQLMNSMENLIIPHKEVEAKIYSSSSD